MAAPVSGRVLVGAVTFVTGAGLWFFTRGAVARARDRRHPAASLPRVGVAAAALGLSVMASAQPGLSWSISSICFSLVAIVLLALVARDSLRR